MKSHTILALALLSINCLTSTSLYAGGSGASPTNAHEGPKTGCGNGCVTDTPYCKECEEYESYQAFQADTGNQACLASSGNPIYAYNGNAQRTIKDLSIEGVAGPPFTFTRLSATRLSGRNLTKGAFGKEGAWSHNHEWAFRKSANARYTVTYPDGREITFKPPVGGGNP